MGGYMCEHGRLIVPRVERVFKRLGELEETVLDERVVEQARFAKRQAKFDRRDGRAPKKPAPKPAVLDGGDAAAADENDDAADENGLKLAKLQGESHKELYYRSKLGIAVGNSARIAAQAQALVDSARRSGILAGQHARIHKQGFR